VISNDLPTLALLDECVADVFERGKFGNNETIEAFSMTNSASTSELPNEPIGMLPDGTLNVVKFDDPPFEPLIIDDLGEGIRRESKESEPM
jgi:hypothetical protein